MQELKFSTAPSIKLIVDGKEYLLKKPTVGQVRKMEHSQKESANNFEAVLDCLAECGLPKGVAESLQMEELNELMETMIPVAKKKA